MRRRRAICYYEALGVSSRATTDEIRKAFRILAQRLHPDKNPDDPESVESFRQALEAYETLMDPKLRGRYDKANGHSGGQAQHDRGRQRAGEDAGQNGDGSAQSFDEVFQDFFGMDRPTSREHFPVDLRFDLLVSRSVLREGLRDQISYSRVVYCESCLGRGVTNRRIECQACCGSGKIEEPCSIWVWVPPGTEGGARIRIQGVGDRPWPGRAPGDLVVLVEIVEV